jgi:hypothetical protein
LVADAQSRFRGDGQRSRPRAADRSPERLPPRVTPAGDNAKRDVQWLLIEWRDGETEPASYFFATLPEHIDKRALIRIVVQQWRTARVYEDVKGELGIDHFEGKRFPGWHHHVSVALCCYAFLVAERVRCFPPSAGRPPEDDSDPLPARTALLRRLHHRSALHRAKRRFMAPSPARVSSSKELVTQYCQGQRKKFNPSLKLAAGASEAQSAA